MAEYLDLSGTEQVISQTSAEIEKKQDRLKEAVVQTMELITAAEAEAEQGKALIAEALGTIGVSVDAGASFEEMAQKIKGIGLGFEAAAMTHPDVLGAALKWNARGAGSHDLCIEPKDKERTFSEEELKQICIYTLRKMGCPEQLNPPEYLYSDLRVIQATPKDVIISAYVMPEVGCDFETQTKPDAENAMRQYFAQSLLNKPVTLAALVNVLYCLPSVQNCRFLMPSVDFAPNKDIVEYATLKTLTFRELKG